MYKDSTNTNMTKKDRLNFAFEHLKKKGKFHTAKELAGIMKSNYTNLSNAMNGDERYLTDSFLKRFNKTFDDYFNIRWLIDGIGDEYTAGENINKIDGSGNIMSNSNIGGHSVNISGNSEFEKIIEKDRIELTRQGAESKIYLQEINSLKSEIERLEAIIKSKDETIAAKDEMIRLQKNIISSTNK